MLDEDERHSRRIIQGFEELPNGIEASGRATNRDDEGRCVWIQRAVVERRHATALVLFDHDRSRPPERVTIEATRGAGKRGTNSSRVPARRGNLSRVGSR